MAIRVLQMIAVTLWIVGSIAGVAYAGGPVWAAAVLCVPAVWWMLSWRDLGYRKTTAVNPPRHPRSAEWQARIDARVAELRAGPGYRRKYIEKAERYGILYSDEQIDYMEDAGRVASCEHLRPLEASLRAKGAWMEWPRKGLVLSGLRLKKEWPVAGCVVWETAPGPDVHAPDVWRVRCTVCGDAIEEGYWAESGKD